MLIAGTNGKGSTAAMVHAALGEAGFRAGLYTSPHLVEFTERIRVGDGEIARDDVLRGIATLRARVDSEGSGLTSFEVAPVLASRWRIRHRRWARQWAVSSPWRATILAV